MRIILLAILLAASGAAHAQSLFTFSNQAGEHGVGVRYVRQYDLTRPFKPQRFFSKIRGGKGEPGRPIQTVIWYPAEKGGSNIRYDDYLTLLGWETDFNLSPRDEARLVNAWLDMVTEGKRTAQVERERNRLTWAVRDAVPKDGKFPVVIYAPSLNNTAFENADLAEYLASHGQPDHRHGGPLYQEGSHPC